MATTSTRPPDRGRRLVMLAPFPPPITGAHKNSALIRSALEVSGANVVSLQTGVAQSRAHRRALTHLLRKAWQSIKNIGRLLKLNGKVSCAYLVPDGGIGIWVSTAYGLALWATRVQRVVVHYRNFSFFRTRHPAMQMLAAVLGDRAHHIFLDDFMRERFEALYGARKHLLVVSNAATCDVTPDTDPEVPHHGPIRVGYLSNLTNEKGFDTVVATFQLLAEQAPDLVFAIAGTPVGDDEARLLEELRAALGKKLSYFGQVEGARKQAFFESLDVFVFPTVYRQEAQPNVIFEALAAGNTVVATRHAAIPGMFGSARHVLIDVHSDDMVGEAVTAIRQEVEHLRDPSRRTATHKDTVASFIQLQSAAKAQFSNLIALLTRP